MNVDNFLGLYFVVLTYFVYAFLVLNVILSFCFKRTNQPLSKLTAKGFGDWMGLIFLITGLVGASLDLIENDLIQINLFLYDINLVVISNKGVNGSVRFEFSIFFKF